MSTPSLLTLTLMQIAYIAGFVDGDGCVNAQIVRRSDYVLKFQIRVSVTFYQSVVRAKFMRNLHKTLNCGTLRLRSDDMIEINVVGPAQVRPLITALQPYCLVKRKQIAALLEVIEDQAKVCNHPGRFLALCKKVDRFSVWNDSKRRTITSDVVRQTFRALGFDCSP